MASTNQGLPPLNMPVISPPLTTITSPWYLFLVNIWNRTGGGAGGGTFQSGDVKISAYGTVPSGWLMCDGSAVSRVTYAALFTAIGITFGRGDGSTTFNVPDFRGRVPLGVSSTIPLGNHATTGGTGSAAITYLAMNFFIKT